MEIYETVMEIRVGYSGDQIACGPVPGVFVSEAKIEIFDPKAGYRTKYIVLASYCEFYNLYETSESIYDRLIDVREESEVGEPVASLCKVPELRKWIAKSPYRKVYELLYGLLEIPDTPVEGLYTEPLPDDDEIVVP